MSKKYQIDNRVSAKHFLYNLCAHNPEFFFLANYFCQVKGKKTGRYFLNYLGREAHELETILDDAEVFTNELYILRELLAGIRWFCWAAIALEEGIIDRYETRGLQDTPAEKKDLLSDAEKSCEYLYQAIYNLCHETIQIVTGYHTSCPEKSNINSYIKFQGRQLLEKNRTRVSVDTQRDAVEMLTTEFINNAEYLEHVYQRLVSKKRAINELEINQALNGFHSLQSFYDTHLYDTVLEQKYSDFWRLRGYIAMSLRLCVIAKDLSHFYERHLLTTRDPEVRQKLSELVQEERLVSVILDFALKQAVHYAQGGARLSLSLLARCTGKTRRVIKLPIGVDGIHARPLTWIHKASQQYGKVTFEVGGEKFEADSMLSLLTMVEGIDRVVGLEDGLGEKDSQFTVSAGTVINQLEDRTDPIVLNNKAFSPATVIQLLEALRAEVHRNPRARFVKVVASGPEEALRDIEIMAEKKFKKELLPSHMSYLFDK